MVLDYKKDMYPNTDTLYIEEVINSTKKYFNDTKS